MFLCQKDVRWTLMHVEGCNRRRVYWLSILSKYCVYKLAERSIVHSQNASQCPHLHMQASKTNFLQVYPLNPPICVLPESFLSSASWMSAYFATTT